MEPKVDSFRRSVKLINSSQTGQEKKKKCYNIRNVRGDDTTDFPDINIKRIRKLKKKLLGYS